MPYQYDPLPTKRHFRFLNVLQGTGSEVQLTLSTHNLNDNPSFEALSYTWGKATRPLRSVQEKLDEPFYRDDPTSMQFETFTVTLNDQRVEVTENLYDVLVQLRDLTYEKKIWVDAICINQNDLEERQSQVSQMGDLYATASKVFIWLGKDESYLEEFAWAHSYLWKFAEQKDGRYRSPRDPKLIAELGLTLDEWDRRWIAYGRFYASRRWFSRAWIVQEMALAKETEVWCGKVKLDIDEMWALQSFMRTLTTWSHELVENWEKPEGSSDFLALCQAMLSVRNGGPDGVAVEMPETNQRWLEFFLKLILLIRTREAGVVHDKIYAGLGICNRFMLGETLPLIVPNYSSTPAEAFTAAASTILLGLPHLDLLSEIEDLSTRETADLPSWTPDFSLGKTHYNFSNLCPYFRASRDLVSNVEVIDAKILRLRGIHIDTITHVSNKLDRKSASPPTKINILLSFSRMIPPVYEHTGQDRLEVLWRTLLADCIDSSRAADDGVKHPAPQNEADGFLEWLLYWNASILNNIDRSGLHPEDPNGRAGFKAFLTQRDALFSDSSIRLPTFAQIEEEAGKYTISTDAARADVSTMPMGDRASFFQARAQRTLVLRRLIRTEKRAFGLAHVSVAPSDEVWMLSGGKVLYVLRKSGVESERYQFVGEAYLHGFMDGEILKAGDADVALRTVKII